MEPTATLLYHTQGVPLFAYREDGTQTIPTVRLDDAEYGRVLQSKVLANTDVVFVNPKRRIFYLARRRNLPMMGWFWLGGNRGGINMPLVDGLRKVIADETGLADFPVERLVLRAGCEYFWKDRVQEPKAMSCHIFGLTFSAEITEEEAAHIALDPGEYEEKSLREFTREGLVREKVFPSILALYDLVFPPIQSAKGGAATLVHEDERRAICELDSPDGGFSVQMFRIKSRIPLGLHAHARKTETFTILDGGGIVLLREVGPNGEAIRSKRIVELKAGSVIRIPPFNTHTFYLEPGSRMHCYSSAAFDSPDFIKTPWLVE